MRISNRNSNKFQNFQQYNGSICVVWLRHSLELYRFTMYSFAFTKLWKLLVLLSMLVFRDGEATDARDVGTVILFIVYFGAIMLIGVNITRVWLRQRERDEQSSRYRTVVVEAAVVEMVETVEQYKAFGTDDCNDLPKKCGFL